MYLGILDIFAGSDVFRYCQAKNDIQKNFLCQLWHVIIFISPLYFQSVFFLEILSFQKSKLISDFCYHFEQSWSEAYYKVYCLTS